MHLTVVGYDQNKRLNAIKGLRSLSGWGLDEARQMLGMIDNGAKIEVPLRLSLSDALWVANHHSLVCVAPNPRAYRRERRRVRLRDLRERLGNHRAFWQPFPVYVTRPSAQGDTGTYTLAGGITVIILILVAANLILWPAIGVYEAIKLIVDI